MAASEKTRNGIITEVMKKSLPISGTPMKAMSRMMASPIRSCRIGNTAMSAA